MRRPSGKVRVDILMGVKHAPRLLPPWIAHVSHLDLQIGKFANDPVNGHGTHVLHIQECADILDAAGIIKTGLQISGMEHGQRMVRIHHVVQRHIGIIAV